MRTRIRDKDKDKDKDKDRDDKGKKGDGDARPTKSEEPAWRPHDPITPVSSNKQREALMLLSEQVLSDKAFQFSPDLLRKLASERWYHWGNESLFFFGGGVDFPIYQRILSIQKIVLGQCLAADTLARLQNQELQADPGSKPLTMAELFRALTDGIWSECTLASARDGSVACSTIRRNLQREHLRKLSAWSWGTSAIPTTTCSASSSCSTPLSLPPTPGAWRGCTWRRSAIGSARSSTRTPGSTTRRGPT